MLTISPFKSQIARRVLFGSAFAATLAATIGAFQDPSRGAAGEDVCAAHAVHPDVHPRSEDSDRSGIHRQDQGIHDAAVLHLAARGLPASVEDRADAEGRARRRRRRARQAAVRRRGLSVHADARKGRAAAREGLLDRQDGRRPRDDRGGDLVGSEHGEARGKSAAPREARRSAHHQSGRCAG